MAKNNLKYYGYINPSKGHPIELIATIKSVLKALRGVVAAVELEDATRYGTRTPSKKTWTLLDSPAGQNERDSYEETSNFGNITLDTFDVTVQNNNLINLTVNTVDNSVATLDLPFDIEDNLLEAKGVGEGQAYQFLIKLEPMPIKSVDDLDSLLPHLLVKMQDVLDTLMLMEDLNITFNGVRDGFTLVDPDSTPDSGDEYWYKEFGTNVNFDVDVGNIFSGNVTSFKVLNDTDEYVNITINPDNSLYFGNNEDISTDNFTVDNTFEYGTTEVLTINVEDTNTSDTATVDIRIDYPLDVEYSTVSIAGYPDTDIQPDTTVTETDGDITGVDYEFKQYIVVDSDVEFTDLTGYTVQWSDDNFVTTTNIPDIDVIIESGDLLIPVPDYGINGKVRILDDTLNAESRNLDFNVLYPLDLKIETGLIGSYSSADINVDSIGTTTGDVTIDIGDLSTIVSVDPAVQTDIAIMGDYIANNADIAGYTFTGNGFGTILINADNVGDLYNAILSVSTTGDQTFTKTHVTGGTGEEDSNQVPISTTTETDGDVTGVEYDFKNYIYLKTNRSDLSTSSLEARWKLDDGFDTFSNNNSLEIEVLDEADDLIKFRIPVYIESFIVELIDNNVSHASRSLVVMSEWANKNSMSNQAYDFDTSRVLDLEITLSADNEIPLDGATISTT